MRISYPRLSQRSVLFFLSLSLSLRLLAEGSREAAPNGNIIISGTPTTDIAALLIDHTLYDLFASYNNNDPNSRLNIHILDPEKECIFLGFSYGHFNQTGPNPAAVPYEYRIKDPNGNVVFGPVFVDGNENIQNWSEATTGPMQIYGAGGYDAVEVTSSDLTSAGWSGPGDYYIEFDYAAAVGTGLLIDFWDISVSDCTVSPVAEKKGRVWSYNWAIFAINDFNFPNRPFNGAFYVCAPDPDNPEAAFITKLDFNGAGFRPAAFNLAINSFGVSNTGNVMQDRQSVDSVNATQPEYAIFLNDPVDLCITADIGEIELLGVSRCDGDEYCIKYIASKEGQVDLLLDFDGPDDVYTPGTADLMLAVDVLPEEVGKPACILWDGKDGLGNPLNESIATPIPVVISYAQGIYHFPIYDAEFMTVGVGVQAIRPAGPTPLLYYDDSQVAVPSGSGEPVMQLSGCIIPCHKWVNFINDDIVGFGNKNTINSWWFSQRIVRSSIFFLPAYLTCAVNGPDRICENTTATLSWEAMAQPTGADIPVVTSSIWTGPDIVGSNEGQSITIDGGGLYTVDLSWITALGDTCGSTCEFQVTVDPISFGSIDTLIATGETVVINGETYTTGGQFEQVLVASNGCDSILLITITILQTVVHFDLDACLSIPTQGSDAVYTEFTPEYPEPLSCATLVASIAHRDNPQVNTHSCTPGVEGSPAICVSSLDSCTYDAGNEKSFVFDITVTPAADTAVALTGLTFYERAPLMYDWINGTTGPNNYPTLYGVRVLKNDVEIFRQADIATSNNWTLQTFDFVGLNEFVVTEATTFTFEMLGYCLVGNGAVVPAWDMDEIKVQASCVSPFGIDGVVSGRVLSEFGQKISEVAITLGEDAEFSNPITGLTDQEGAYAFDAIPQADNYFMKAYKNTGFTNGVSTLDLIRIQKHLLGVRPFDSPLQWIAADANGNEAVSILDIVDLRKLLLGIYSELPQNTSWRFGDPKQNVSLSNPFDLTEVIELKKEDVFQGNINFLAVKIGDVNGSYDALGNQVSYRSQSALQFAFADRQVHAGEIIEVEIRSTGLDDLMGFQCEMKLPQATVLDIRNGALDMRDAFYISGGQLRMSWYSNEPQQVASGEVLFTIVLEVNTKGHLSNFIRLHNGDLQAEAYIGHTEEVVYLHISPVEKKEQSILYQNAPNPFSQQTEINFYLAEKGNASLTLYAMTGQKVWETQAYFDAGLHKIPVSSAELPEGHRILICELRSENFVAANRLIRMD